MIPPFSIVPSLFRKEEKKLECFEKGNQNEDDDFLFSTIVLLVLSTKFYDDIKTNTSRLNKNQSSNDG